MTNISTQRTGVAGTDVRDSTAIFRKFLFDQSM